MKGHTVQILGFENQTASVALVVAKLPETRLMRTGVVCSDKTLFTKQDSMPDLGLRPQFAHSCYDGLLFEYKKDIGF